MPNWTLQPAYSTVHFNMNLYIYNGTFWWNCFPFLRDSPLCILFTFCIVIFIGISIMICILGFYCSCIYNRMLNLCTIYAYNLSKSSFFIKVSLKTSKFSFLKNLMGRGFAVYSTKIKDMFKCLNTSFSVSFWERFCTQKAQGDLLKCFIHFCSLPEVKNNKSYVDCKDKVFVKVRSLLKSKCCFTAVDIKL